MYVSKFTLGLEQRVISLSSCDHPNDNPLLQLILSLQDLLIDKGYILAKCAYASLYCATSEDLIDFHADLKVFFNEMNLNFSEDDFSDVIDTSDIGAKLEEYSDLFKVTDFSNFPEEIVFRKKQCKVIYSVDEDEFVDMCFTNLLRKQYAFNEADKAKLLWFAERQETLNLYFPDVEECKANLKFIASTFKYFTVESPIDVLKVAVAFSDGDVSLPKLPKYTKESTSEERAQILKLRQDFRFKLNTCEKKRILTLFEASSLCTESMSKKAHYNRFIRLAEQLPLFKLQSTYPRTWETFVRLRNKHRAGKPDGYILKKVN